MQVDFKPLKIFRKLMVDFCYSALYKPLSESGQRGELLLTIDIHNQL